MFSLEGELIILVLTGIVFLIVSPIIYIKNKIKRRNDPEFAFRERNKEPWSFKGFMIWLADGALNYLVITTFGGVIAGIYFLFQWLFSS